MQYRAGMRLRRDVLVPAFAQPRGTGRRPAPAPGGGLALALGVALLGAAACEGSDGEGAPPVGNNGTPVSRQDPSVPQAALATPHACQARLTTLAIYQAVKAPLIVDGQPVPARNAPVVEGRPAIFRAFLTLGTTTPGNVQARLRLTSSAGTEVFDDAKLLTQDSTDSSFDTTLNFSVPGDSIRGDSQVAIELDTGSSCPGGGKLTVPAEPMHMRAQYTGSLKMTIVPVQYDADGSGRMPDISDAQIKRYHDALMAVYPTREVQITVRAAVSSTIKLTQPTTNGGWSSFLESVRALRESDDVAPDVYYYALVSPANSFQTYCQGACTAGLSYLVPDSLGGVARQVGAGVGWAGSVAAETLVHEVGHQHGRPHTPCGKGDGPDRNWPTSYVNGSIGVWGLDMYTMGFKDPSRVKDFMGYCNPQWISDYTFTMVADRRSSVITRARLVDDSGAGASLGEGAGAAGEDNYRTLLIEDDGAVQWGAAVRGDGLRAGAPQQAQVLDAAGKVLAEVTVYRTDYGHGTGVSLEVPAPGAGWTYLALPGRSPVRLAGAQTVPALQEIGRFFRRP